MVFLFLNLFTMTVLEDAFRLDTLDNVRRNKVNLAIKSLNVSSSVSVTESRSTYENQDLFVVHTKKNILSKLTFTCRELSLFSQL
jgi:hypothetical protein